MPDPSGVRVETELGPIFIAPIGLLTVGVTAPHLTVDGVPLRASATLTSSDGLNFDLIQTYDAQNQFHPADNAITAQLVDGRSADIVVLGKIVAVMVPAVRRLAQNNRQVFIEAERHALRAYIADLEAEIAQSQMRLDKKKQELAAIEAQLP
jgi:hypothetical protein